MAEASRALLGRVFGLAAFCSFSPNCISSWLSDNTGRPNVFALTGSGSSILTKIILLFASSVTGRSIFRAIERLGKGFQARRATHGCRQSLMRLLADICLACLLRITSRIVCFVYKRWRIAVV